MRPRGACPLINSRGGRDDRIGDQADRRLRRPHHVDFRRGRFLFGRLRHRRLVSARGGVRRRPPRQRRHDARPRIDLLRGGRVRYKPDLAALDRLEVQRHHGGERDRRVSLRHLRQSGTMPAQLDVRRIERRIDLDDARHPHGRDRLDAVRLPLLRVPERHRLPVLPLLLHVAQRRGKVPLPRRARVLLRRSRHRPARDGRRWPPRS